MEENLRGLGVEGLERSLGRRKAEIRKPVKSCGRSRPVTLVVAPQVLAGRGARPRAREGTGCLAAAGAEASTHFRPQALALQATSRALRASAGIHVAGGPQVAAGAGMFEAPAAPQRAPAGPQCSTGISGRQGHRDCGRVTKGDVADGASAAACFPLVAQDGLRGCAGPLGDPQGRA